MSLDEAKELELQDRCLAERLELATIVQMKRFKVQRHAHAHACQKWVWHIKFHPKHPPTVNPGSTPVLCYAIPFHGNMILFNKQYILTHIIACI